MRADLLTIACLLLLAAVPPARAAGPAEPAPGPQARLIFEGNEGLYTRTLRAAMSSFREDLGAREPDAGLLEDAAYELERFYASWGYRDADVVAESVRSAGVEGFAIRFVIVEGTLSLFAGISFEGAETLGADRLEACFQWPRNGLFGLGEAVFTDAALSSGLERVTSRYQLDGHYFAVATAAVTERPATGEVFVHVLVEEGPKVSLVERPRLEWDGARSFEETEIQDLLDIEVPSTYVPRLPLIVKGKIIDHYRNRGYRFVDVDVRPEVDREAATARLVVRIQEGPRTRIGSVRFEGAERTARWVLAKRLKLEEGDWYSEDRIRDSYRSLFASGLFSSVTIETAPMDGSPDLLDLSVRVVEKSRFRISVLGGFGSWEYLRGKVTAEYANIFGTGHRVSVTGKGSFRGYGASADYLNPLVFSDRLSHRARGFYELRENPSFTEEKYGGETGFGYRFTDNLSSGIAYRLAESDATDFSTVIPEELRQDVLLSSVIFSTSLDDRNSVASPDEGSSHRLSLEYSGEGLGSELDFLRVGAGTTWILPLGELRLVASARAGAIARLRDTDVIPVQERYYLGGDSTVRSFHQDEAGPKIQGEPIGGEAYTLFNVELRFPLLLLENLDGSIFGDAGSVVEDITEFGGGRYLFAVGAGIRYDTPFGPLRVDMGFNPDRAPGEDLFVVHVGLGYPF